MCERKRESVGDRETVHALSFAATTDPFHIDAAVNVTPVSRACPALAFSALLLSQLDAAFARGC